MSHDPGTPADVRALIGDFGALNQYGTMAASVVVAGEGVDERLIGALIHPTLDGVLVATIKGTPSGEVPIAELTAMLREWGWRWATDEEALELFRGYLIPGLEPRPHVDGGARARAIRALT